MTQKQDFPPEQYAEISPTNDDHDRPLLVVQERHGDGHRVHALSSDAPIQESNDILERHQMQDGTINWGAMSETEQNAVLAERDVEVAVDDVLTPKLNADT